MHMKTFQENLRKKQSKGIMKKMKKVLIGSQLSNGYPSPGLLHYTAQLQHLTFFFFYSTVVSFEIFGKCEFSDVILYYYFSGGSDILFSQNNKMNKYHQRTTVNCITHIFG